MSVHHLLWALILGILTGCFADRDWDDSSRNDATPDCDDRDAAIRPDAVEVCDHIDNDCDGLIDDEDPDVETAGQPYFWVDQDGDEFGNPAEPRQMCWKADGFADNALDCDDTDPEIRPNSDQFELCDGKDNDCDPATRERGVALVADDGTLIDYTNRLLSLQNDASPIELAIDRPSTLYVCPGVWPLSLRIEDDFQIIAPEGPEHTVLDGRYLAPVVSVQAGRAPPDVLVQGIKIARAGKNRLFGGSMHCDGPASLTVDNVEVDASVAPSSSRVGDLGGAVSAVDQCTLQISNSTLQGSGPTVTGGLLHIEGSNVTANNTTFIGGHSLSCGGAVAVNVRQYAPDPVYETASFGCEECSFIDNRSDGLGGALCLGPDTTATLDRSTLRQNAAEHAAGCYLASEGEGTGQGSCVLILDNTRFEDNVRESAGPTEPSVVVITTPESIYWSDQQSYDFEGTTTSRVCSDSREPEGGCQ